MSEKTQDATIKIEKKGVQKTLVRPSKRSKKRSRYKFKGMEIISFE